MFAKKTNRRKYGSLLAVASFTVLSLGLAQPAFAGNMDGHCEAGEFCMYYLHNYAGPVADMEWNEPNFQGKTFANSSISRNDNGESGNDRGRTMTGCLYSAANYSGSVVNQGAGGDPSDPGAKKWTGFGGLDDTASSLHWIWALWCQM